MVASATREVAKVGAFDLGRSRNNPLRYVHNSPVNFTDPSGLAEELPEGTPKNEYKGLGSWEFDSAGDAYRFFEILLPDEDRPDGWRDKVGLGCVGLNSLRIGDPSGLPAGVVFQNAFTRKDAHIFTNQAAAEERLAALAKANPGKTYILVAMQITATDAGKRKFAGLGDGPYKPLDLMGIIDPTKIGQFNFATRIPLGDGQACWEWMNHGLDVVAEDLPAVRHREELPEGYDATFYIVVEKKPWK